VICQIVTVTYVPLLNTTYPETITQEVSPERLKCFFHKEKHHYRIKKEIREMVIFGLQNIVQEPSFTKLDIISCRNVLIYLNTESQRKLFPLFHFSLKPNGVLFLGMSESASHYSELFTPLVKKWKLFERKEVTSSSGYTFLSRAPRKNSLDFLPQKISTDKNTVLVNVIKHFLIEQLIAPFMIINRDGFVVFYNEKITDYLLTPPPHLNDNILDIIHPKIKSTLIPALYRATTQRTPIHLNKLNINTPSHSRCINLTITPIQGIDALNGLLIVNFENVADDDKVNTHTTAASNINLLDIEQELKFTKENLQATIEELETSNEELQSTNEELQSINEELETSKEELQSVNEELVIVNTELQNRIEQIAAVNDDMNNLFNSTDVAAFFLDNSLLIKRFTPKAQELIHLIPADIGRSFKHFATNIKDINLIELAEEVLKTLEHKSLDVQTTNEQWYSVHVLPYRTLSNMIDGVVITFTNITHNKIIEEKLSKLNNELQDELTFSENILDTVREPLITLSSNLKIISANRSFYNKFLLKPTDVVNKFFYDIEDKQWNLPKLRKLLDQVITQDLVFEGYEIEHTFPRLGHKKLLINARKIIRQKTGRDMILLALDDR
jgi:two-component system CheB/CheR fusion protein